MAAGPGVGAGHVARGVALAQAWQDRGGEARLVTAGLPHGWPERVAASGVQVAAPGPELEADWWVLDGYALGVDDAPSGARIGRIDDFGRSPRHPADLVVDQNLGSSAELYPGAGGAVLVGPRYALVRRELRRAAREHPSRDRAVTGARHLRLLVAQGGTPAPTTTDRIAAVLTDPRLAEVEPILWAGATDPVPGLTSADVALAAAGSSVWELLLFGVPAVVFTVADNQEPVAAALDRAGLADSVGSLAGASTESIVATVARLVAEPDLRRSRKVAGRRVVDGFGAPRVAARLRGALVGLRPADPGDVESVHRWNDDPLVRAASFSSDPIAWSEHVRWFEARLADPSSRLYVASDHLGVALGIVRFSIEQRTARIGIALAAERRGGGWGPAVISAACARLTDEVTVDRVLAEVKADNEASNRAFTEADFDLDPASTAEVRRYVFRP